MYRFLSFLLLVELNPLEFHPGPCLRSGEAGKGLGTVTLSTHFNLYRQQCSAIFFIFSALEAEIIVSLGHSWPFFLLLKRLYTITIKAGALDGQRRLQ